MRRIRRFAAGTAAAAILALAAACGTPQAAGSPAAAIPSQDVVSTIKAVPALKAELPSAVRDRDSLTVGTPFAPGTSSLPHAGQTPQGADVGLDVDLRNAVGAVLGIKWNVQKGTFATIVPGVQNGKYDVGQANFGVTKSREQAIDFATYLNDGQAFLAAKGVDINKVNDITDLCGHTVATSPGSTFQQILTSNAQKCAAAGKKPYTAQYFPDTGPIFLGLANGKIDIYFGPTLSLKYDVTHVPGTRLLNQFSSTPVGFVTAKGSPTVRAISAAVNHLISTGDYARILNKWSVGGDGVPKSEVNPPATF